jgi:hypothetical protein
VSEQISHVTGQYYTDCKAANYSPLADDVNLTNRLWLMSEELCGLRKLEEQELQPEGFFFKPSQSKYE